MMVNPVFDDVMEGLKEFRAFLKGEELGGLKVYIPEALDVAGIRKKSGLTQVDFAARIGVPVGTLRGWEQGRRVPDGAARVLLAMLARNPRVVEETLQPDAAEPANR